MNSRTLTWLSIVALVIVLLAIWVGHSRTPRMVEQEALYPQLKGKLADIQGLSIYKAGDQLAVELTRDDKTWKVKQRYDYPADVGKVGKLLVDLESAKLREQKTANPANYGALAVQDLSDTSTTGVRLELTGIETPLKLIVGKRDGATRSTYVRRAGEAQSWLIGAELDVPVEPTQWLKRDIIDISADRIQEATVQISGSPPYTLFKNSRADANYDIKGLPKGRELDSVSAANAIAHTLAALQLEDVQPASALHEKKPNARTVYRTFDGLTIEAAGYVHDDRRWITFKVSHDPELTKRFHLPTQTAQPEGTQTADPKPATPSKDAATDTSLDSALKKGQDEAAAITGAVSAWAYAIPTYKYDAIFKPLEDLLKKSELVKKR